ncbi:shikimate dehydrogenase [candidate division KSB1 bacterium]|nr:shikimate dehydrogenase [candidate division KSB1 bacterium]
MPDPQKQILGVIGDPIEHSLSPILHNFVISRLKLNYCYHAFRIRPAQLTTALEAFSLLGITGINVTIPHKEAAFQLAHRLDDSAIEIGAVNTLYFHENIWWGYNTDGIGFLKSLGKLTTRLPGSKTIIIGAGGSAKAILSALISQQVAEIYIYNRTQSKAEALALEFIQKTGFQSIFVLENNVQKLDVLLSGASLLVNTTPLGMYPHLNASPIDGKIKIPDSLIVYDLIYNPMRTKLLNQAEKTGATVMNGLDMLIYQGIAALEIWTGLKIDISSYFEEIKILLESKL